MAAKGIVAAGHDLTAEAAQLVLREGGNAFDAVVAAYFAACVAEPVLCSLGGGGFLLALTEGNRARVYDYFVQTPRRKRASDELDFRPISADFGAAQQEFHIGLGSIATPGAVKGVFEIHSQLCSMSVGDLVAPAIQYAREGVPINSLQAYIFRIIEPIYLATPQARAIYESKTRPDHLVGEAERLYQPDLAEMLEHLAIEGADLFYRGELAQMMATACREGGGHLALEDLENYTVELREPLAIDYRDFRVLTNPPPSSGGVLIAFALRILDGLNIGQFKFGGEEHLGLLAEVMALTNKARVDAHLDQTCAHPNTGLLLDERYLKLYRDQIRNRATSSRGTTHISVMDSSGNVASMTVSNGEGSGHMLSGTGVMLNNMLGEEDLNPHGFHRWEPNDRMTSMMSPSILQARDGRVVATGSGGSNRIRTALLQVLINIVDFEMDLEPAVYSPRIHHETETLDVEAGFDTDAITRLLAGYPKTKIWDDLNLFFGGAHTVMSLGSDFEGVGDPRRGGVCQIVR